ncbi:MAG: SLBB domain-containing protein [Planctomycetales bacterium]|nr:SLBB domain-containing protein [Planctomycetales bacterium]
MPRIDLLTMMVLLVAATVATGCRSPIFRARNLPPEFRVAANKGESNLNLSTLASAGSKNSLLAPGDLLEVTIATGRDDERVAPMIVRVANDGTVAIPLIGPVPVSGMEAFDASQSITTTAIERGIYLHPVVTVDVKTRAVNRITVLGAVTNPGVHEIPRGSCDVVTALAAAGGLTEKASTEIEVMRQASQNTFLAANDAAPKSENGNVQLAAYQSLQSSGAPVAPQNVPQVSRINLADARFPGRIDSRLNDRDVVMVTKRKSKVFHVSGLVNKPGQFELPVDQDVHLLDGIAMAGGRSSPVANKVFVIRRLENRPEPIVIQASLAEAKHNGAENIRLTAGDTVTIEQTPATVVVDTLSKIINVSVGIAGRTTVF